MLAAGQPVSLDLLMDVCQRERDHVMTRTNLYQVKGTTIKALKLLEAGGERWVGNVRGEGYRWAGPRSYVLVLDGPPIDGSA
jgi:hypothetical protein